MKSASTVLLLGVLTLPGAASAQDVVVGDRSQIIRTRACPVEDRCPARQGLVWDSTNAIPPYPPALRAAGVGGDVLLALRVGPDGRVDERSVTVVRSSMRAFEAASIETVRGWHFGAEAAGRPAGAVSVQVHLIYTHLGACQGNSSTPRLGWAGVNQVVTVACNPTVSRSQLRRPS